MLFSSYYQVLIKLKPRQDPVGLDEVSYRTEVKGNTIRLIIDTVTIFEDTDKDHLFPLSGQVGLITGDFRVKGTSFKGIAA